MMVEEVYKRLLHAIIATSKIATPHFQLQEEKGNRLEQKFHDDKATMTQQYDYRYIETGSIRLLRIIAVKPEIILHVQHAPLDSKPVYNALSYTWGKPLFTERVRLDSGYLNVTPSLHHCLTCLEEYVGANIWIDAICINQKDNEEKSRQVQQMARVYDEAAKVLCWIGPEADQSDNGLRGVNTYGKEAADAGILTMREQVFSQPEVGADDEDPEITQRRETLLQLLRRASDSEGNDERIADRLPRVAFASLTHRDYFTRVWVKQEVTLAKMGVIICGHASAPLEHFNAMLLFYGMLQMWEVVEYRAGRITRVPGPFSEEELMEHGNPWALLQTAATNDAIGYLLSGRRKRQEGKPEPLARLLHQAYVRDEMPPLGCEKPEDKIWGLSGIASDIGELGLKAAYGVDTAEMVYENTARALLKQGRIDVLKWCRSRGSRFPSWIPNWELPIRRAWSEDDGNPFFKPFQKGNFNLDQGVPVNVDEPGSISLHGVKIDIIKETGSLWRATLQAKFDQPSLIVMIQELITFLTNSRYSEAEKSEAIWRIPIGDKELPESSPYYVRATPRSTEQVELLCSRAMDEDMMSKTHSYQACARTNYESRPVVTEGGFVGLVPSESLPGDVIVLFVGGTTPFVLRRLHEESGKQGFLLVGECFIYGMMDGEFSNGDEEVTTFQLW